MPLTPQKIADALLKQCFQRRDTATEIAAIRAAETFAWEPAVSNVWRDVHKVLTEQVQL